MDCEDEADFSLTAALNPKVKPGSEDALSGDFKKQLSLTVPTQPCHADSSRSNPTEKQNAKDASDKADVEKRDKTIEYDFDHPSRGTCVIFNNIIFDPALQQAERKGSEKDAKNIQVTFESLGFEVKYHEDCTCYKMYSVLEKESKSDHSGADCFVCVILSHGGRDKFLKTDGSVREVEADVIFGTDTYMFLKDLTELLYEDNCLSLKDKPKIFITQACRGSELSREVSYLETTQASGQKEIVACSSASDHTDDDVTTAFRMNVPIDVNFLLISSSPPGFFSLRNEKKGSVFINALCDKLTKHSKHLDFLTILTRMKHHVAYEYKVYAPSKPQIHGFKQMPWIATTLTKDIYFRDKELQLKDV